MRLTEILTLVEDDINSFSRSRPLRRPINSPMETPKNKFYTDVPFNEIKNAKKLGLKWDTDKRKYYFDNRNDLRRYNTLIQGKN